MVGLREGAGGIPAPDGLSMYTNKAFNVFYLNAGGLLFALVIHVDNLILKLIYELAGGHEKRRTNCKQLAAQSSYGCAVRDP